MPQPLPTILAKVQPLILDGSNGVRLQLIKLFQALPSEKLAEHVEQLLLYVRAGLTHLAAEIRSTSLDVLQWLLDIAGDEVVSCPGGWAKTLRCFVGLLGWQGNDAGNWSFARASFGKASNESKIVVKQLNALGSFLKAGIAPPLDKTSIKEDTGFPVWHYSQHTIPARSHCFQHLDLFGTRREEESQMFEDRADRYRHLEEWGRSAITEGLERAKKEGGEVGRAAGFVAKVLADGIAAFEADVQT